MEGNVKNEDFLHNYGGVEVNDLTRLINNETEYDDESANMIKVSNYYNIDDFFK